MPTAIHHRREAIGEERSANALSSSQEVIFSLSLANLCFLLVWQLAIALAADAQTKYFEMTPPSFGFVAALLLDIGLLAAVIYLLVQARRRYAFGSICLAVLCVFVLLETEQLAEQYFPEFSSATRLLAATAGVLALLTIRRAKRIVKHLVLLLSPLLPVLILDASWLYSRPELQRLRTDHVAGKLPVTTSRNRLVWIIFDEMDYHLAFEVRPSRVPLPELDRLRDSSLSADRAHSPAMYTILSLPSLLTGRRAVSEKHRVNDIALGFEGSSEWQDLSLQPNIFRRLRSAGFNTAIDGWHHPYCRVLGNDLSDCASAPHGDDSLAFYNGVIAWPFLQRCLAIAVWDAESITIARESFSKVNSSSAGHPHTQTAAASSAEVSPSRSLYRRANIRSRAVREQQIAAAQLIADNALRMVRDPDLNLVLIHAPAPHLPGIWNSTTRQFTATERSDYMDNLGFADTLLGRIRRALEQSGEWDRTTVLISADHPFRVGVWQYSSLWTPELARLTQGKQAEYVPFILKLPAETEPFPYHRDFNTVLSGDLIWEILNGNIQRPQEAARWLDARCLR